MTEAERILNPWRLTVTTVIDCLFFFLFSFLIPKFWKEGLKSQGFCLGTIHKRHRQSFLGFWHLLPNACNFILIHQQIFIHYRFPPLLSSVFFGRTLNNVLNCRSPILLVCKKKWWLWNQYVYNFCLLSVMKIYYLEG